MAKSQRKLTRGTEFTRTYDLHGVGGDLSELVNMYVDYEGGGSDIETLPGFRSILSLGEKISGLYRQKLDTGEEYLIIHAGTGLYRAKAGAGSAAEKIATLSSTESTAFTLGESLYILDGTRITELSSDGVVKNISDTPYIPTTYKNGVPYEERNLLSKWSYQEYNVEAAEDFTYGSPHLLYSISDYKERECAVSGVDKTKADSLYIPTYKYIGGIRYAVTEILPNALENSLITELTVAEGVTKIGDNAVRDCKNLKRVILPSSISEIGKYAFAGATTLEYARLGIGLTKIGTGAFGSCPALTSIAYEGSSSQLATVEGVGALDAKSKQYNVIYTTVTVAFSTHGLGFEPYTLDIDGVSFPFSKPSINEVRVALNYKSELEGKRVRIYGREVKEVGMRCALGGDLMALYASKISPEEAIYGCKAATVLDGRVFLTANPRLPGIVFYSTENADGENSPHYFGSYDFFDTGGSYPVSALLALSDSLIVTKSGEAGEGSILSYERGKTQSAPRSTRYVKTEAYRVTGGISHAAVYSGTPLFLAGRKLYKLSGSPKTLNPISEDLGFNYTSSEDIFSLEWQGYLFLSIGNRYFLLDNRGEQRLRTYPLSGIGSYKNSTRVYVFADTAPLGYAVSDKLGEAPYESVISELTESGETVYYVLLGGVKVAVLPTEELSGGSFYPANSAVAIGSLLYFGTDSGEVCLFNNDKRGVAPDRIKNSQGFDISEYERTMANKIHPDFYDFMGHRIHYCLKTTSDGCDDTSTSKLTLPEGTVLEFSSEKSLPISYAVLHDGQLKESARLTLGPLDFENLDFSALSLSPSTYTAYSLPEEQKPWVRHGIKISEAAFRAPIKITSLSLGYKTGKKIKN